jgi:hypothetical protein
MIAYEIDCQLLADGEKVGTLLLVEPTVVGNSVSLANKVANAMLVSDSLLAGLQQLRSGYLDRLRHGQESIRERWLPRATLL